MAASEIKGSRARVWQTLFARGGIMLFVSTDGAHGLTVGTSVFSAYGGGPDSGPLARRLTRVEDDDQSFPGLILHKAYYSAPLGV